MSKEGGRRGCILLITSLWYLWGMFLPQLPKLTLFSNCLAARRQSVGNGEALGGAFVSGSQHWAEVEILNPELL